MTETVKTTKAKKPAQPVEAPAAPKRITSANRKPLAPNLGEGHVIRV